MGKRTAFKYGRGRCIFCERQPPEVKLSKEHVFADWLRAIFPRSDKITHTLGYVNWTTAPGKSRPTITAKRGQGHSGSKKVRAVCRSCNETWLSNDIEDAAKLILIPLMANQAVILNVEMQWRLARWAAKTVMTCEQIDPTRAVVHQPERTWLMQNLAPPEGWNIWIGSYVGTDWRELGIYQHLGKLAVPSINHDATIEHNLQLTIIGMGHLLFLVINSSWSRIWDILDRMGSPNSLGLARIWPIREPMISWPRPFSLNDRDAQYFATYLARVLQQPV